MKKVLFALMLSSAATAVTAEPLRHPDGWTFETAEACNAEYYTYNGERYDVGRYKGKLVVGEYITDVKCGARGMGGGGGGSSNGGGQSLSDSQAEFGAMNPGETTGSESQQGENDDGSDAGFSAISG